MSVDLCVCQFLSILVKDFVKLFSIGLYLRSGTGKVYIYKACFTFHLLHITSPFINKPGG